MDCHVSENIRVLTGCELRIHSTRSSTYSRKLAAVNSRLRTEISSSPSVCRLPCANSSTAKPASTTSAPFAASNFFRTAAKAKVDATKVQMKQLGNVLDLYRQECGTYPTTEQGLDALLNEPASEPKCTNYDKEGYLKEKKIPGDGFGNPFLYESDGSKYVLISLGADKKEGGADENRDLRSDQPE